MAKQYWLMKSEPDVYGWDDLVKEKEGMWDGVRNHAARRQAMVARAHQHLGGVQHRGFGAQDHAQAQCQALQQAQRAQGLGLVVNEVLQAVGQRGIMQVSNGWKYER